MRVGSLFSGAGGLDMAVAGFFVLWDCPRPIRNPMPAMTLFPRVERLEAAAHTWSRRVRAAVDCLTGRMDLTLGYDDDGWD